MLPLPGLFRFEDTGVQGDEVVRRLNRRVGDFHVEHPVERGWVVAWIEERAKSSPGFRLDLLVLAGEFTGGIKQLLAELAHACVEARELVPGEQPDAWLWKGEGFSPPVARGLAADPGNVAEARVLGVEDELRGREELLTRPGKLWPPWSVVRGPRSCGRPAT